MGKIEYISVEEQVEKLKSQNLIISDEVFAKNCLEQFGYSNLIKSYREPYVIISDEGKKFRSDIKFEQIVSLYILDKNLRIAVMAAMLDLEEHIKEVKKESNFSEDQLVSLMMDTLYISLEYRNIAAHGGRIFNYKCNRELRSNNSERSEEGFCLLLRLLNFLEYQSPYKYLENALTQELNRHCKAFPQDVTYLSQILNLNITSYQIAWINSKSNKYHLNKYCSGLKNAREIELEKVKELGFIKCRKCCG